MKAIHLLERIDQRAIQLRRRTGPLKPPEFRAQKHDRPGRGHQLAFVESSRKGLTLDQSSSTETAVDCQQQPNRAPFKKCAPGRLKGSR